MIHYLTNLKTYSIKYGQMKKRFNTTAIVNEKLAENNTFLQNDVNALEKDIKALRKEDQNLKDSLAMFSNPGENVQKFLRMIA